MESQIIPMERTFNRWLAIIAFVGSALRPVATFAPPPCIRLHCTIEFEKHGTMRIFRLAIVDPMNNERKQNSFFHLICAVSSGAKIVQTKIIFSVSIYSSRPRPIATVTNAVNSSIAQFGTKFFVFIRVPLAVNVPGSAGELAWDVQVGCGSNWNRPRKETSKWVKAILIERRCPLKRIFAANGLEFQLIGSIQSPDGHLPRRDDKLVQRNWKKPSVQITARGFSHCERIALDWRSKEI